jgi:DNA polymerase/3'-5' exonuclease PolX
MLEEKRYPYLYIKPIADRVLQLLKPHCDIIHIAGSIRRKTSDAKDIEIVCFPKKEIKDQDLFGTGEHIVSRDFVEALSAITKISIKGNVTGRYLQVVLVSCGITLDLFLPSKDDYYRQLAIRTGSWEYTHKVIAHGWRRLGWVGSDHGLRRESDCIVKKNNQGEAVGWKCIRLDGEIPPAWQSEEEFFNWIGVKFLPPELRDLKTTLNEGQ